MPSYAVAQKGAAAVKIPEGSSYKLINFGEGLPGAEVFGKTVVSLHHALRRGSSTFNIPLSRDDHDQI